MTQATIKISNLGPIKTNTELTEVERLRQAQIAAHAAWKACPASKKIEKAKLGEELAAAGRAVLAAKRAAEPVIDPIDVASRIAAAVAAQEARRAEAALRTAVRAAVRKLAAANEWPRCGQYWPMNQSEQDADSLIRANISIAQEEA